MATPGIAIDFARPTPPNQDKRWKLVDAPVLIHSVAARKWLPGRPCRACAIDMFLITGRISRSSPETCSQYRKIPTTNTCALITSPYQFSSTERFLWLQKVLFPGRAAN